MRGLGAVLAFLVAVLVPACGSDPPPAAREGTGTVLVSSPQRLEEAIRSLRPRPVVVNYWATWCEPCKEEMPRFVAAAGRYTRVAFLGVNVEDDLESAQRFVRRYGISFASHALSRTQVQETQDILGLPVTQFYRGDGELAFVHQGEISGDDLDEKIDELLRIGRPVESAPAQ